MPSRANRPLRRNVWLIGPGLLVWILIMQLMGGEPLWSAALIAVAVVVLLVPLFLIAEWAYSAARETWERYRPGLQASTLGPGPGTEAIPPTTPDGHDASEAPHRDRDEVGQKQTQTGGFEFLLFAFFVLAVLWLIF